MRFNPLAQPPAATPPASPPPPHAAKKAAKKKAVATPQTHPLAAIVAAMSDDSIRLLVGSAEANPAQIRAEFSAFLGANPSFTVLRTAWSAWRAESSKTLYVSSDSPAAAPTVAAPERPTEPAADTPAFPLLSSALARCASRTFPQAIHDALSVVGLAEAFESALQGKREDGFHARLTLRGYMPLSIETIGFGRVSVMHWFIQNGDLMRDPEIVFQVFEHDGRPAWVPVELTQHPVGHYSDAYDATGHAIVPSAARKILELANMWARNLSEQGWTERAELEPPTREEREEAQADAPAVIVPFEKAVQPDTPANRLRSAMASLFPTP